MLSKLRLLVLCAFLALTFVGCASSNVDKLARVELPAIPNGIRNCLRERQIALPDRDLLTNDVVEIIARLIQSERRKTECGLQLAQFYEDLRKRLK